MRWLPEPESGDYQEYDLKCINCNCYFRSKALIPCEKVQDPANIRFGRWIEIPAGMTPGGTPMYACAVCGGTEHLHGAEYPGRKVFCDSCGRINFYPWEKILDEGLK